MRSSASVAAENLTDPFPLLLPGAPQARDHYRSAELSPAALENLRGYVGVIKTRLGWANARDAGTIADKILEAYTVRCVKQQLAPGASISPEDVDQGVQDLLRRPVAVSASIQISPPPQATATAFQHGHQHAHEHQHGHEEQKAAAQEGDDDDEEMPGLPASYRMDKLPQEFHTRLQELLEQHGITSEEALEAAATGGLPQQIEQALGNELQALVPQWQEAYRADLQVRREIAVKAKKLKKVPIYQCQACGRYTCNYMPRIVGFKEIEY